MPHGQASKEARVFKNFASPSGTAGESFIAPWTNGVDGDDLSFFVGNDSNSDGIFNWYLQGSKIFRMEHSIAHGDGGSGATFWGSGGVYLGKSASRWSMAWLTGFQSTAETSVWNGASAFGYASIEATTVTGTAQTVTPPSQVFRLAASGGAASVLKIAKPPQDFPVVLTIIFDDANVTLTDSGTGGAAETMNLNGGDYTSSVDGVVRLLWCNNPASGNDRWLEVSRTSP